MVQAYNDSTTGTYGLSVGEEVLLATDVGSLNLRVTFEPHANHCLPHPFQQSSVFRIIRAIPYPPIGLLLPQSNVGLRNPYLG